MASSILQNLDQWSICIPEARCLEGIVFYDIRVRIGDVHWPVSRRYNEFAQLDATLVKEQGLSRDLLPPKKYLGNLKTEFIEHRRSQLELYINKVFHLLVKTMPFELAAFLRLDERDVMFLIRKIPTILSTTAASLESPTLSLLQVHALSCRLKLPCPPAEMIGYQHDFSGILEACSKLKLLQIEGRSVKTLCWGTLPSVDFLPFKSLKSLILNDVPPNVINNADLLRNMLCGFSWVNSALHSIEDALLCDSLHKHLTDLADHKTWLIKKADFSSNSLMMIGDTASILPELVALELNNNQIQSLRGLNNLKKLEKLSVKMNGITNFVKLDLDATLLNLTWINLGGNKLKSVKGLEEFKMLRFVDVSDNLISEWSEIALLCSLPLLVNLVAFGNPISSDCDYRVKILEMFDERVKFVSLDNQPSTQKEFDRVAVLQALRIVKEGRSPM